MTTISRKSIGAVVIGRNEGERLRRCLDSIRAERLQTVYVDSGSTDGSIDMARSHGVEVVELDLTIPFTAARARNAGARRLCEQHDSVEFILFLDGDCELIPGWLDAAIDAMGSGERVAVVCGRRCERRPQDTVYNLLCDMEWNTPVGETMACGGDALIRRTALNAVDGYDETLIAGEEPEMCLRMRREKWTIKRIAFDMTLHDADITRFGQWWKRSVRCGHAFAEGMALHGRSPERYRVRDVRSTIAWGAVLPLIALLAAPFTFGLSLLLVGTYAFLWLRVYGHRLRAGASSDDANLYAGFCVLSKIAQMEGVLRFWWNRWRGRRSGIIEYKRASTTPTAEGA